MTRIDIACYERGCACHDDRVDGETVEVVQRREWVGLTDEDVKAPIQRAMQHFGYDPTQYSLGGAATIGFYGLAKEIEAKLREKNRDYD